MVRKTSSRTFDIIVLSFHLHRLQHKYCVNIFSYAATSLCKIWPVTNQNVFYTVHKKLMCSEHCNTVHKKLICSEHCNTVHKKLMCNAHCNTVHKKLMCSEHCNTMNTVTQCTRSYCAVNTVTQ